MGGEEFAVLLPGTDLDGAPRWPSGSAPSSPTEAIMREAVGGAGLTTSIGVVQYESGTPHELLRAPTQRCIAPRSREKTVLPVRWPANRLTMMVSLASGIEP